MAQLSCQIQGDPKPLLEWILPDGSKVRAPYSSEDRRIIITAEGKLTLRGADASDTGLYRCIATNYLDADILMFRVTVLSPDVEEADVNGVQLSMPLGKNLVLDCSSSGSPEASVHWIHPDHSVLDRSLGNRKVYNNGTLLIEGLTSRDRGFYRCLVGNHLGVDLLVSQVMLTGERPEMTVVVDTEGSGMHMEVKVDPSLTETSEVILNEITSSSPSYRNSQESRTITSDRPYPRYRSPGRKGSRNRVGQKRRGPYYQSNRVFDKASRKVDPQKFAEFMKKAKVNSSTERKGIKHEDSNNGLSGNGEIGSGDNEDHFIVVPKLVTAAIDNLLIGRDRQTEEAYPTDIMETTVRNYNGMSKITEYTHTPTTESYMQSDATPVESTFTHDPHFVQTTDFKEKNTFPVSFQLTVTDTSQETQLQFSGEQPSEPETSTEAALSFTTVPNITAVRSGPGPVELIHTDPNSHTTFTAVTTTERKQDEITLHTTQTIKSPRLPAGSTIISQQQIHIIPNKNVRGGGRRRTFNGRRRIIKPNRIIDIQSFISKVKQPSVKKEENASVPYIIELTTGK